MKNYTRFIFMILITLILCFGLSFSNVYATNISIHRISGETRYDTAANIAKEGWASSEWAIIAYGGNFPDALASAPLAVKYDAPILLTEKQNLTSITKNTLTSLGTTKVIIVGGTSAVSLTVEDQLKSMGIYVTRLSGIDRYDTSVEIAKNINNESNKLIVTTGSDFPNALSVSSYAGKNHIPIVLISTSRISDSLKDYLSSHNIQQTYLIGNANEISDTVKELLPNVLRIQGNDKYETNLAILNTFETGYTFNNTFIATGNNFADALAGSSYAAKIGAPIILTDVIKDNRISSYLTSKSSKISKLNILGGENALPASLISSYSDFDQTLSAKTIFDSLNSSVVYIEIYNSTGKAIASGSGFIVDSDGKIATNFHVINGANSAKVKTTSGEVYDIYKVLAYDQQKDIALVKINGSNLTPVTFGNSDSINTGDKIYTIGNPLGLENTISDGLISAKSRIVNNSAFIQISAPISHGSSGGVLLNEQGQVIGITSSGIDKGQNLNFAIPINVVKPMLSEDIGLTLAELSPAKTPSVPTQPTYTAYFPELSTVPMPIGFNYNEMGYGNNRTTVWYKYYYSYITSSFSPSYYDLLINSGWTYHKQETVSGALMTSFVKGNYLMAVIVMSDGIEIMGTIH